MGTDFRTLICDFDGTLVQGNIEQSLIAFLRRKGYLGLRNYLLAGATMSVNALRKAMSKGVLLRAWQAGLPQELVDEAMNQFLVSDRCPAVDQEVLQFVQGHAGRKMLLTGSDERLVRAYLEVMGLTGVFDVVNGLRGGKLRVRSHPYGKDKVRYLQRDGWLIGIGNEYADRFFLACCDEAYVHQPDERLRVLAEDEGWKTI